MSDYKLKFDGYNLKLYNGSSYVKRLFGNGRQGFCEPSRM
jgi:hypothetical protein